MEKIGKKEREGIIPYKTNKKEKLNFMAYGKEKTKEFVSRVRQVIVAKPDATLIQIRDVLADNGVKLDIKYIMKLVHKIRRERYTRYDNQTVKKVLAEFEDFISSTGNELLKISKTSKLDMARIMALDTRVKHYNILLDKLFDAGVFERKIGTIDAKYTNVAEMLKLLKDERDNQRKLKLSRKQVVIDSTALPEDKPGISEHRESQD